MKREAQTTDLKLINIDPKEYGLQETKALEISNMFSPMLEKMVALENEYNEVVSLDMGDEKIEKATVLLKKYVKTRTGTAEIHRELKAFYLAGGRFVDSWKNAQKLASESKEKNLKDIKEHYENLEKERIANLFNTRKVLLLEYDEEYIPSDLGSMNDDIWQRYYEGVKASYKQKQEAIKQDKLEAERLKMERLEKERLEAIENERIRKENEKLRKEAEAKEAILAKERAKTKAASDKLAKELQAKKDAELKEQQAKEAAEAKAKLEAEQLAKAPIKKQMSVWVDSFQISKPLIDNDQTKIIYDKFESFKDWAKQQIETV